MRNQKFYIYSLGAVLLSIFTGLLAFRELFLPAGAIGLGLLGFRYMASREGNRSGRTDKMKLTKSLSENISEVIVISSVLISGLVGKTIILGLFAALCIEKAYMGDLKNRVLRIMSLRFGSDLRILLASLILLASQFNPHSAFWGSILLASTVFYDTTYLVYSGFSEA
ncbi:MAG: hypothetical protein H8Z69_04690 [Nanohaloarchaea archaeon]|nr:hypothetical protein [Candidatus Nanohaloarchaea archaeon]